MTARRDNFGPLRLAAAVAVLASHAFLLSGRVDPFGRLAGESLGDVAVAVFFAISGFLVAGSWCRDPNVRRFLWRRIRRIWPALMIAVLFTAYVIGPAVTNLRAGQYLDSGQVPGYVLAKLAMLPGSRLPGVFTLNPQVDANDSLWTLPVEVKAYLLLLVMAAAGAFRRRSVLLLAWLITAEAAVFFRAFDIVPTTIIYPRAVYLFSVFLGGVLLYRERDRVPLRGDLAVVLVGAWLVSRGTVMQPAIGAAALPYVCLWLAYGVRPVLARFVERADLSYGLYLYGYPVEQVIRASAGRAAGPLLLMAVALPVTGVLAAASWFGIERRFLRHRRRSRSSVVLQARVPLAANGDS